VAELKLRIALITNQTNQPQLNQYNPGVIAPNEAAVFLLATAGVERGVPAVTSVANQKSTALHAHSPIAEHESNPYFQSSWRFVVLAPGPERQQPLGLAQTF
jgi:hypothetical protein